MRFYVKAESIAKQAAQCVFLEMLPQIEEQVRCAFRGERPEQRAELVQEGRANAWKAYDRLVERGLIHLAYATPLANYAIRQIRSGRRVGTSLNVNDITSIHARRVRGIVVEALDKFDSETGDWMEVLVEDRKAGPAETAAARIDVAAWLRSLGKTKRRIAEALARGERTRDVARQFGLTDGRISQLRTEFRDSWEVFQAQAG